VPPPLLLLLPLLPLLPLLLVEPPLEPLLLLVDPPPELLLLDPELDPLTPQTPPRGTHTLTSWPLAELTVVHASVAGHPAPFAHDAAQYVSPPN
jgi:hypothetical protein